MFTEDNIGGLSEDDQRGVRAILAKARGFKFSEESLRLRKLMRTDPDAACVLLNEKAKKNFEKNIGPQRDVLFRQLQQKKDAEDAAARKQKKRQRVVASPPDMTLKTSRVVEDTESGHSRSSVLQKMMK